jgi:hypothetical protein
MTKRSFRNGGNTKHDRREIGSGHRVALTAVFPDAIVI